MKDVGNIQVQNKRNLKLSKQRSDLEELLISQLENGRLFKENKSKLGTESESMLQMNQEECANIEKSWKRKLPHNIIHRLRRQ